LDRLDKLRQAQTQTPTVSANIPQVSRQSSRILLTPTPKLGINPVLLVHLKKSFSTTKPRRKQKKISQQTLYGE